MAEWDLSALEEDVEELEDAVYNGEEDAARTWTSKGESLPSFRDALDGADFRLPWSLHADMHRDEELVGYVFPEHIASFNTNFSADSKQELSPVLDEAPHAADEIDLEGGEIYNFHLNEILHPVIDGDQWTLSLEEKQSVLAFHDRLSALELFTVHGLVYEDVGGDLYLLHYDPGMYTVRDDGDGSKTMDKKKFRSTANGRLDMDSDPIFKGAESDGQVFEAYGFVPFADGLEQVSQTLDFISNHYKLEADLASLRDIDQLERGYETAWEEASRVEQVIDYAEDRVEEWIEGIEYTGKEADTPPPEPWPAETEGEKESLMDYTYNHRESSFLDEVSEDEDSPYKDAVDLVEDLLYDGEEYVGEARTESSSSGEYTAITKTMTEDAPTALQLKWKSLRWKMMGLSTRLLRARYLQEER